MPSHIVSFSDSACVGGAASVAIAADMVTTIEAPLKDIMMSLHDWTLWTGYLTFADARLLTALPLPFTLGGFRLPRWLLASKTTIDFEGKQARGWRQELAHSVRWRGAGAACYRTVQVISTNTAAGALLIHLQPASMRRLCRGLEIPWAKC
jgi:hypothetical protein